MTKPRRIEDAGLILYAIPRIEYKTYNDLVRAVQELLRYHGPDWRDRNRFIESDIGSVAGDKQVNTLIACLDAVLTIQTAYGIFYKPGEHIETNE